MINRKRVVIVQFHQFGAEVLGSQSPVVDSEVICMVVQLLKDFGLKDLNVEVNSVGCPTCRPVYREKLIAFFEPKKEQLCSELPRTVVQKSFAYTGL